MPGTIKIRAGQVEVTATLNDTKTAEAIWKALPITGRVNRWGDEIYFSIRVKLGSENGTEVVENGDIAYWPPGHAFCIFFGRTPASRGQEIRAASAVNLFGKVSGDTAALRKVKDGEEIRIEAV